MRFERLVVLFALCIVLLLGASLATAQDGPPPAEIVNDEGGPVLITGTMAYTNVLFPIGIAQPLILLEDQGGFVTRDRGFLFPPESQVLGQLTSDFFESPVSFSLSLPIEPQGTYHDVDNDDNDDIGVQIFAVAFWNNVFGDPYLEERDMYGGGWSNAFASTRTSEDFETRDEIVGGVLIVYAPDDQQGFPSGFGPDGLLFTGDEPIVRLPQGYTAVILDTDPFTFDRSREIFVELFEPEGFALADFSDLSYTEAFDAMLDKFRREYAFTEYKGIDWDALAEAFRPRFEAAEARRSMNDYLFAMRDFVWSIPDGHIALYPGGFVLDQDFQMNVAGGIGMAIQDVADGSTIVYFLTPFGPAEQAGIQIGAEILEIDGLPVDEAVSAVVPYSSPFSSPEVERLQQLRYVVRSPLNVQRVVTFRNPGSSQAQTVTLTPVQEFDSFAVSSFAFGLTGFELPLEYRLLPSGIAYVKIYSFFDNDLLTVQLWERLMRTLNDNGVPALIVDMRQNGGGSGFLADQMAAYFFDEPLNISYSASYDRSLDQFVVQEDRPSRFYLPSEDLRYRGDVVVIVGPACASACESFSYAARLENRATIIGHYGTAGLGGGVDDFAMPDGQFVRMTVTRTIDEEGNVTIEGVGVQPDIRVPVTLETLTADFDVLLRAAEEYLLGGVLPESGFSFETTVVGDVMVGDVVTGFIEVGERRQYTLTVKNDVTIDIALGGDGVVVDTFLRLYDQEGFLIAENDDVVLGRELNSALSGIQLAAGDVIIIEVGTYADSDTGPYVLEVVEAQ
jgi:C-terminal processing protease CtpA/Prc